MKPAWSLRSTKSLFVRRMLLLPSLALILCSQLFELSVTTKIVWTAISVVGLTLYLLTWIFRDRIL